MLLYPYLLDQDGRLIQWRKPGAEFGGTEIFFADQDGFFSEKIRIFTAKISYDLFLVIDHVFRIFPFFSQISVSFTMFNVVYGPFITRTTTISEKNSFMTPFFTLFVLSRASDNTTSQNIGGTNAWAV